MNTPNKLTIARMIATPIFMFFMLADFIPFRFTVALVLFAAASITDYIDGNMARKQNIVTNFGKFLDPLADKFLVLGALLALLKKYSAELGDLLVWVTLVVILRELAVTSLRLVAVNKSGKVIAASIWGKLKTVSQMVAIICVFLEPVIITPYIHTPAYLLSYITLVFMMVTTIFSGVDYFVKFLK